MTRDVLVSITGARFSEHDKEDVEMIIGGDYFWKNGKHYVLYEEVMEESGEVVKNTVKITPDSMDILKKGIADADWPAKVDAFEKAAYEAVYSLGGRISGEHGIGEKRKDLMVTYTDPVELELMKAVKKAFDPNNILNPGKIFELDD